MVDEYPDVAMGDVVIYFDDDKQPHAAIVAHVLETLSHRTERFICNLAIYKGDGRMAARKHVEPAYSDGEKWILVNKWAHRKEVPDDEWNYLPPEQFRGMVVGAGEHIPTT